MPTIEKYEAKKTQLEGLRIPPGNRKVLIKTLSRNVDERTKSGIWVISETDADWDAARHSDRWGEVIKVPRDPLPFEIGKDKMPWRTTVQIHVGDIVWYDYLQSLNSVMYVDEEGSEYRLIDYENLYISTFPRINGEDHPHAHPSLDGEKWILPLNGYHVFERIHHESRSKFDVFGPMRINRRIGRVKYVAQNNLEYENASESDHVDLKEGDIVNFNSIPEVTLEDEAHCTFDGGVMYRRAQARSVDLVWRDGNLILPKGRLLLRKFNDEGITPAGIILPKPKVKNHRGEVIVSSVHECKAGSRVKYIKGAGVDIEYKGKKLRLIQEHHVLYVEG